MLIALRQKNLLAQSVFEYTVMIIIISTALMVMGKYIQRAVNARLKTIQVELTESKR